MPASARNRRTSTRAASEKSTHTRVTSVRSLTVSASTSGATDVVACRSRPAPTNTMGAVSSDFSSRPDSTPQANTVAATRATAPAVTPPSDRDEATWASPERGENGGAVHFAPIGSRPQAPAHRSLGGERTEPGSPMTAHDDLADFRGRRFEHDGNSRTVHVAGTGPGVIVMPEMPGISPDVARFARWVRDAGFTVYLPSLFGVDGAYPTTEQGRRIIERACVSKEFRAFAGGGTSPIVGWLRALARLAHE